MKKVVSFSGGRSSAKAVLRVIEVFGAENVAVVFMDTGAEHPKTYEFVRNVVEVFGIDLICLRGDFSLPLGQGVGYKVVPLDECKADLVPFKEMVEKYGTPYIGGMFCTDRMKLKPFKKYCDDHFLETKTTKERIEYFEETGDAWEDESYETWLGIRVDEPKRLSNKKGIRYLAEICSDEKPDIIKWFSQQVFDLEIPDWLGNCMYCPKKSNLKLAAAQRDEPGHYIDWLEMINSDSVRMVDTRTISYMKHIGIKNREPYTLFRRSNAFLRKLEEYNENLFTPRNKKWKEYEKAASLAMYRGKKSLVQVIAMFDGLTGDEIKARIRGGKMTDTGSCSESCEVFVCEANQMDMF